MIDLDAVTAAVGDARVVGLGESLHAVSDFYRLKDEVFRHLVEHAGFRIFALESGFAEGLLVDTWIKGSGDDLDDVLRRGFTYNMGCCEEFVEQLTWMRAWNEAHPDDPVHYAGTDLPGWLESADRAFHVVDAYLAEVDPDAPVRGSKDAIELADWLALREPEYAKRSTTLAAASATRAAETAAALARLHADAERHGPRSPLAGSMRELTMARTILWLLHVHGPSARIAFGAHNGHLQRTPPWGWDRAIATGGYLAHHLGDAYVPIATTFGEASGFGDTPGPEPEVDLEVAGYGPAPTDTVDHAMAQRSTPIVDLRREQIDGARMRVQGYTAAMDVAAAFDVLIHLDHVRFFTPRSLDRPDG